MYGIGCFWDALKKFSLFVKILVFLENYSTDIQKNRV